MIAISRFISCLCSGRSSGIQTHDLTHPKGARDQAALYSEVEGGNYSLPLFNLENLYFNSSMLSILSGSGMIASTGHTPMQLGSS